MIVTGKLRKIDYEEFLENYADAEYSNQGGFSSGFSSGFQVSVGDDVPFFVFQAQNLEYGVYPVPDKEYVLDYEYFALPTDLELHSDVPSIPQAFEFAISYGALMHMYALRAIVTGKL